MAATPDAVKTEAPLCALYTIVDTSNCTERGFRFSSSAALAAAAAASAWAAAAVARETRSPLTADVARIACMMEEVSDCQPDRWTSSGMPPERTARKEIPSATTMKTRAIPHGQATTRRVKQPGVTGSYSGLPAYRSSSSSATAFPPLSPLSPPPLPLPPPPSPSCGVVLAATMSLPLGVGARNPPWPPPLLASRCSKRASKSEPSLWLDAVRCAVGTAGRAARGAADSLCGGAVPGGSNPPAACRASKYLSARGVKWWCS